jgi:hypothetical protein
MCLEDLNQGLDHRNLSKLGSLYIKKNCLNIATISKQRSYIISYGLLNIARKLNHQNDSLFEESNHLLLRRLMHNWNFIFKVYELSFEIFRFGCVMRKFWAPKTVRFITWQFLKFPFQKFKEKIIWCKPCEELKLMLLGDSNDLFQVKAMMYLVNSC